jgi:hypothetical protein
MVFVSMAVKLHAFAEKKQHQQQRTVAAAAASNSFINGKTMCTTEMAKNIKLKSKSRWERGAGEEVGFTQRPSPAARRPA